MKYLLSDRDVRVRFSKAIVIKLTMGAFAVCGLSTAAFAATLTLSSTPPAGGPGIYTLHTACTASSTPQSITIQRKKIPGGAFTMLSSGMGKCANGGANFSYSLDTTSWPAGTYKVRGSFGSAISNPLIYHNP